MKISKRSCIWSSGKVTRRSPRIDLGLKLDVQDDLPPIDGDPVDGVGDALGDRFEQGREGLDDLDVGISSRIDQGHEGRGVAVDEESGGDVFFTHGSQSKQSPHQQENAIKSREIGAKGAASADIRPNVGRYPAETR